MKKNIVNKLVLVTFSLVLLLSCEKDYLEVVNPNAQSTATFWRNNTDLNSGLTTVYHALAQDNVLKIPQENTRTDIAYPGFNRLQSNDPFYTYTYNDGNGDIADKWEALYAIIFRANQVIINGERLLATYTNEETIEDGTQIVAQARFLRGWAYFTLYNLFNQGSVILFDFIPEDESEFFQPLASSEDVKAFFLADLEYARANLEPIWDLADKGRVTSGTATAVLGKHYLYEENYAMATEMFRDVISNTDYGYGLVADIEDNFSEAGEFNRESIFEIGYSIQLKAEQGGGGNILNVSNGWARWVASVGGGGFRGMVASASLYISYKNDPMDTVDARNYVDSLSVDGDPVMDDGGAVIRILRDHSLRTSASVALGDDFDTPWYGGLTPAQVGQFNNQEYAYFRKYGNWRTVEKEDDIVPQDKSPLNIRLIRLADVYLMLAEALIEGGTNDGGLEEALILTNAVRQRSGLRLLGLNGTGNFPGSDHDNISYNANTLMNHLMFVERPLELALEGQATRFLDLRRWGVIQSRFDETSSKEYYGRETSYIDIEGEPAVLNNYSQMFEGIDPLTGEIDFEDRVKDNVQAAGNYSPGIHDYYPIPASERTSNPNL